MSSARSSPRCSVSPLLWSGPAEVGWGRLASLLLGACLAIACLSSCCLMSQMMSRIGRLRTSAGRVSLGVSIGAHSGGFDLYLIGGRHRELVVTGPAATVTAAWRRSPRPVK